MSNGLSQEEINGLRELREFPKRQQVQDDKAEPRSFPNETRLEMKKKLPLVSSRTNLDNMPGIPDKTVAQWTTNSLTAAGIDPDKFTAHLIRAAASIYAVQQGASIREVKIHANWSLNADTFEKYYLRPANRRQQGQMISKRVLEESHTAIVEGTTHNSLVGETETEDMVGACPWY
ncbi:hypothetical protein G6F57_019453 [Rhizopus arrhizus]|nr:hypothetical protein G6F57_019453 [Rhizopus arrhizus]